MLQGICSVKWTAAYDENLSNFKQQIN